MKERDSVLNSSVPITLDGRDFVLRYRAFAFIAYTERTGGDLLADVQDMARQLSAAQPALAGAADAPAFHVGKMFKLVCDVLWAGLLDVQPEIKRDEISRWFGFADFMPIAEAILGALRLTMPQVAPGAEAKERPTIAPVVNGHDSAPSNGIDYGQSSVPSAESAPVNSLPLPYGTSGI